MRPAGLKKPVFRAVKTAVISSAGSMAITGAIAPVLFPAAPILAPLALAGSIPLLLSFPIALRTYIQSERITALYEELQAANARLIELNAINERRATVDEMTGFYLRRHFFESAEKLIKKKKQGAVIMLDIDRFKVINDTWGHAAGDEALKQISDAIRRAVRPDDIVGRLGGEEFAVYLPNVDVELAMTVAERIRLNVETLRFVPDGENDHPLSISVGLVKNTHSDTIDLAIKAADAALYRSKRAGRNRVSLWQLEDRERAA